MTGARFCCVKRLAVCAVESVRLENRRHIMYSRDRNDVSLSQNMSHWRSRYCVKRRVSEAACLFAVSVCPREN